jgi:hypothetical protein
VSERRTFIVRFYGDAVPILEDVASGERVRLPDLASLECELKRRLRDGIDDAARDPGDASAATPE